MSYVRLDGCFWITFTCYRWQNLLHTAARKQIVYDSLSYFHGRGAGCHGFVLMPNHIHLIISLPDLIPIQKFRHQFKSYSSKRILKDLSMEERNTCHVNASNKHFQIWETGGSIVEVFSPRFYLTKLQYTHRNPVKAGLCKQDHEYSDSSANSYRIGETEFGFLSLLRV